MVENSSGHNLLPHLRRDIYIYMYNEQRVRLNDTEQMNWKKMDKILDIVRCGQPSIYRLLCNTLDSYQLKPFTLPSNAIFRCTCGQFPVV